MKATLFASFGTSHEDAQASCLDSVADDLSARMETTRVAQAYTSSIIRRVLARRGQQVPDVLHALAQLSCEGVTEVVVQPGHLMPGEEYDKLRSQVVAALPLFDQVSLGEPLLGCTEDVERVVRIMAEHYPAREGRAVVLMGHGTDRFSNVVYAAMNFHAHCMGRDDMIIGTVEAQPDLEGVLRLLEAGGFDKVVLAPLMLVAGDHAKNDMAGDDEDSWASRMRACGYKVTCCLEGLGQIPAIRDLYVEHALGARSLGKAGA